MKGIQRTQVSAESCCVSVIPRRYSHPVVYNDFRPARRPLCLGRGRAMTELLGTSGQEYDTRLAAVRAFMLERRLDAVLLSAPENIFYRSEEHTSELQSPMRISYAVFRFTQKKCKHN